MTNGYQDKHDRPPLEWELAGEFKNQEFFVRVNRARGRRIFSMEMGGLKKDGTPGRFFSMQWDVVDGAIVLAPHNPSSLIALIDQAKTHVADILTKEGAHEKRSDERQPMRKGKSDRDRNRRREREA